MFLILYFDWSLEIKQRLKICILYNNISDCIILEYFSTFHLSFHFLYQIKKEFKSSYDLQVRWQRQIWKQNNTSRSLVRLIKSSTFGLVLSKRNGTHIYTAAQCLSQLPLSIFFSFLFKFWQLRWLILVSKIQLEVYYQCCVLIGWAITRLYVIAH